MEKWTPALARVASDCSVAAAWISITVLVFTVFLR